MQENSSYLCSEVSTKQNQSFTGPFDLRAPNQQNSQLVLFSDKAIGAQPVAEFWGRVEGYIPHQRKYNVQMNIKLI